MDFRMSIGVEPIRMRTDRGIVITGYSAAATAQLLLHVQPPLDHRWDELVLLGHLAVAELREVVPSALRADLLLVGHLVLDAAGDELALLLGVLAASLDRCDPLRLGAVGVADRRRDGWHLLRPLPEDLTLQLLQRAVDRGELTAKVADLGLQLLGFVAPLAAVILAAHWRL